MDTGIFSAFRGRAVPHVPQQATTWGTESDSSQVIENTHISECVPHVPHVPQQIDNVWNEEDWQAAFDERAAILEYDAGMSRPAAEAMARREIDEQRRRA